MWSSGSTKWVFRFKPNKMFSTERKVHKGIEKNSRSFEPKPRLRWFKGGFSAFLFFLLITVLGISVFWIFYNDPGELMEKRKKINQFEQKTRDANFDYLLRNANRAFVMGDFIFAKKELDIALKIHPKDKDANRLYIQTWIQLIEKYPQYRSMAIEETKESVKYLSDSESDRMILKVFDEVVIQE